MRLLIDNNLPPFLADVLDPIASLNGHSVIHIRREFEDAKIADVDWMSEFSRNRDAAFLSRDLSIRKKPEEVQMFRRSGITGFWLVSKTWSQYLRQEQHNILAGRLCLRWPQLVQAVEVGTGQAFEIPVSGAKLRAL